MLLVLQIPEAISADLEKYFVQIRDELRTGTLEKASAGKFVETVVQVLQSLDPARKSCDESVTAVDRELRETYESRRINGIPDDSRLAIVRLARAMYCIRSKRGLVHKTGLDPSLYDLDLVFTCARWIMTELVRLSSGCSLQDAKELVEDIQRPVYPVVEHVMGRNLVLTNKVTAGEEILLVLSLEQTVKGPVLWKALNKSLDRRNATTVSRAAMKLWKDRLVEGDRKLGYVLTRKGAQAASEVRRRLANGKAG